jgi:hypothetical protein
MLGGHGETWMPDEDGELATATTEVAQELALVAQWWRWMADVVLGCLCLVDAGGSRSGAGLRGL